MVSSIPLLHDVTVCGSHQAVESLSAWNVPAGQIAHWPLLVADAGVAALGATEVGISGGASASLMSRRELTATLTG